MFLSCMSAPSQALDVSKWTDTLNVTRCYCKSPGLASDGLFGSYTHFSYYNYHLDPELPPRIQLPY